MLAGLSKEETLALFGGYYRDVVATPEGDDHPNIRNFMKSGWEGVPAGSNCPLGSVPARLLRLLRARLAALAGSALPGKRPAHWAPSHCLGCSS